jgi:hypothetical protein
VYMIREKTFVTFIIIIIIIRSYSGHILLCV